MLFFGCLRASPWSLTAAAAATTARTSASVGWLRASWLRMIPPAPTLPTRPWAVATSGVWWPHRTTSSPRLAATMSAGASTRP